MFRHLPVAAALGIVMAAPVAAEEVVVFAAASLKGALDTVAAVYQTTTGNTVTISYAGSNLLANQILQGAPADIYISAAENWMDEVEKAGLLAPDTRTNLLGNALVLVAHGKGAAPVVIGPGFDLAALVGEGKLAMAMVDAVPAGQYGKQSLQSLGLWSAVAPKVVQSENVQAALVLVCSGEAPYGIVYASDAIEDDNVTVIAMLPPDSHAPIVYPAALLTNAADAADRAFFSALMDSAADAEFKKHGFAVMN